MIRQTPNANLSCGVSERARDRRLAVDPMISVVMPVLNAQPYVREAIESAMCQTGPTFELIVQDGGSTDGTIELVRRLGDPRITLRVEQDAGQADALNRAIRAASGEWVFWLNADDLVAPGAFASAAPALRTSDDIVYGAWGIVNVKGELVKRYTPGALTSERLLTRGSFVFSGGAFFRREFLVTRGGFDADLTYCMDYELLLRTVPGARITRVSGDIGYLRTHRATKSYLDPWGFFREHWKIARRHAEGNVGLSRVALAQLKMGAYIVTRPLWRSGLWLRLRPRKNW